METPDIDLLTCVRAFLNVVDNGSFTSAALNLNLTASALSKQVAKLESALGMCLLDRSTRNLRLSGDGAEIIDDCRDFVAKSHRLLSFNEKSSTEVSGWLRILVPPLFETFSTWPAIREALIDHPKLRLLVDYMDLEYENSGSYDFEIRLTDSPPEDRVAKKILNLEYGIYASKSYLREIKFSRQLPDFVNFRWLALSNQVPKHNYRISYEGNEVSFCPEFYFCSRDPSLVMSMLKTGAGACCLPKKLVVTDDEFVEILPGCSCLGGWPTEAWMLYSVPKYKSAKKRVTLEIINKIVKSSKII